MSGEAIISVEGVSKAYPVYHKPADMLWEILTGVKRHDAFWALKDISFTVKEKQRIGIIGPNGSGKSTLLKLITGNIPPTSGKICVGGKISALLSLATSLNPEETGLENIRFNLILNGCKSSSIKKLVDEIVDFTELGHFIYAPVKTYSSGMNAKLAFAIATAIEPEILIIDEVLSVGDAYFMGKATKRVMDMCEMGKALLLVSHSTSALQMLCDTGIWMDNGSIRMIGPVDQVVKQYEEDYRRHEDKVVISGNARQALKREKSFGVDSNEIEEMDVLRLRLIPTGQARFHDTHYVRRIHLAGDGVESQDISLGILDFKRREASASLDLLNSEWGRMYSRNGSDCRILTTKSGKSSGGQILVRAPKEAMEKGAWKITLTVESTSVLGKEDVGLEYTNYKEARWEKADQVKRVKMRDGWDMIQTQMEIHFERDREKYQETIERILQRAKPKVEILETYVVVNGEPVSHVRETEPFEIRVKVLANQPTPLADVGIKIMRSDGVYTFWQSSGITYGNLVNLNGEATVHFRFETNFFSGGDYDISAFCGNGWDPVNNFPHSEIFDFTVNSRRFTVLRDHKVLSFGIINLSVPVFVSFHGSQPIAEQAEDRKATGQ
jgi:ABC-type polysaccharide/polyol phosphate transport system ATPase subunit